MKNPRDFPLILERIKSAENWRDSCYKDKFEKNLRQYHSLADPKPKGQSNIYVPYTFMQCEVIKARVNESLFAQEPWVTLLPRGQEDAELAKVFQTLLNWQFSERMDIKREFAEDITNDAVVFGTTVIYTGWKLKTRRVKTKESFSYPLADEFGNLFLDEQGLPIMNAALRPVEQEEVVYDDPVCQKIDIFDFFTDPQAANIADARFCGHVEYLTRGQIESLEQTNGWQVDWESLTPEDNITGGKEIRSQIAGNSTQTGAEGTYSQNDKGGLYKVHQYWEDNRHVAIINEQQCAIDEENPFWHGQKPYDKCCYIPRSNEFYGNGVPDILRDLQDELNTSRNMRLDYNAMALRRMWKVRKDCGLTKQDLVWKQNGVLQVNEMDDVQEINVANLPASAFTNEEIIKQDMRDATGCHDIIMGLADADETATTTMTKDNNASLRFKYFINALVDDIMIPLAKKCVSLDQQFLDGERVIRLVGEEADQILTVHPEDLLGDYDIQYVGTAVEPMANKELYKQKVLDTYNLAMSNPLTQGAPESQLALLEELLSAMEIKNIQAVVQPLRQVVEQQKQMQMQMMMQQQQALGMQPGVASGAMPGGGAPMNQSMPI